MNKEYVASREYLYLIYKWYRSLDEKGLGERFCRKAPDVLAQARLYQQALLG